jgi:hypothetical protein
VYGGSSSANQWAANWSLGNAGNMSSTNQGAWATQTL